MIAEPDWGLYEALRGRDDYAQQRQDAMQNQMYLQLQQQQGQKKLEAEQQAQDAVHKYFNDAAAAAQNALPGDKEKIQSFVTDLKQPIIEGIKNYGGDLNAWKIGGGHSDLDQFGHDLLNKPDERGVNPVQNAVANKQLYGLAVADQKAGLVPRSVVGQNGLEPFNLQQQLQELKAGKRDRIEYNGAYKPTKYNPAELTNLYNPEDKNTPYQYTTADLVANASAQGLEPEEIMHLVDKYRDRDVPGKVMLWTKHDEKNPLEDAYKRSQIAKNYWEMNKGGGGDNGTDTLANKIHAIVTDNPDAYDEKTTTDPNLNESKEGFYPNKKVSYLLSGTVVGKHYEDADGKSVPAGTPGAKLIEEKVESVISNGNGTYKAVLSDGRKVDFDKKNAGSAIFEPALKHGAYDTKSRNAERVRAKSKGWENGTGVGEWDKETGKFVTPQKPAKGVQDYSKIFSTK